VGALTPKPALAAGSTDDGKKLLRDEVGLEFANDQAARDEGTRAIVEMASDYLPSPEPQKNITMWVRNAGGTPLLQLSISFAIQPLA
jgi:hypothetical protein